MTDLIVIGLLCLILGGALYYVRREKRKGVRCIGCPDGAGCSGTCPGCKGFQK